MSSKEAFRKTWSAKYTLRSHFDGVRSLAFHPSEPVLITASEDQTLKMWNLQKTITSKKSTQLDVEPVYTFRGHTGPVLCLCVSTTGDYCFSGGVDGSVRCWTIPPPSVDPYDTYDASVMFNVLTGHSDRWTNIFLLKWSKYFSTRIVSGVSVTIPPGNSYCPAPLMELSSSGLQPIQVNKFFPIEIDNAQ